MAWIESHTKLPSHPKVKHLARIMGWDVYKTIGSLHAFWYWCVDYAEDGDLTRYNDDVIGDCVGLTGKEAGKFVAALKQSCWVDSEPYFRVHDWWDYIGKWLQSKYKRSPAKWRAVCSRYVPGTQPETEPTEQDTTNRDAAHRATPDSLDAVKEYFALHGHLDGDCEAEKFWNFYESKGWKVGRNAMKDWHAAAAGWNARNKSGAFAAAGEPCEAVTETNGQFFAFQQFLAKQGLRFGDDYEIGKISSTQRKFTGRDMRKHYAAFMKNYRE
ncbi:MAG TPA: hypothetical protein VFJ29_03555 [Candidatus Kapabacteria bacterium]|nr:hypothetical protein [Candidatus Kapabacteria bacterium]